MIIHEVSSSLYLIEAQNGLVKIGCSKWPDSRLKTVRLHCCEPTRLIAMWPGRKRDELALHLRFAAQRIHTEWFRPDGEFASFIAEMRGRGVARIEDWDECCYRPSGSAPDIRRKKASDAMKAAWSRPGARERWSRSMRAARRHFDVPANRDRNDQILTLRLEGLSLAEIGARFGISRQRVEQIVKHRQPAPVSEGAAS